MSLWITCIQNNNLCNVYTRQDYCSIISDTAVLCRMFQKDLTTEINTTGEQNCVRFEFKMSFGRVSYTVAAHDDVIKWKHFQRYWPFVRGIHRWRGRPVTRSFNVFFGLQVTTWPVKCGMHLLIHSQTSMVALLKFGNGWVISSHTL